MEIENENVFEQEKAKKNREEREVGKEAVEMNEPSIS